MAVLGDLDHVKRMLRPSTSTDFGVDVDERLEAIQVAVSAILEETMGRSFGSETADTTVIVYGGYSPILILPTPARSITSVTVGGTVTGGTVTGGSVYTTSHYAHWNMDTQTGAIHGLRLISGGNWGYTDIHNRPLVPVVVVGDFTSTDSDAIIPDDVQYCANFLIAERFKMESASPAGYIGPDGMTIPIRDAWKDPMVVKIIDRYRADAYEVAV
jgi:hypothetical protein